EEMVVERGLPHVVVARQNPEAFAVPVLLPEDRRFAAQQRELVVRRAVQEAIRVDDVHVAELHCEVPLLRRCRGTTATRRSPSSCATAVFTKRRWRAKAAALCGSSPVTASSSASLAK